MKRREFSIHLVGSGLALATLAGGTGLALAQGNPVEGKDYVRLAQPAPSSAPPGKIEVIEFFWYGSPHCMAFEPLVDAWRRKLPADVAFHRVPVVFRPQHTAHAKIFFLLDALGKVDALHRRVFDAIDVEHRQLETAQQVKTFMNENGVDGAKVVDEFNSFAIQTKLRQAGQLQEAYKIDSLPALGIQGRYHTGSSLAGSNERALQVAEYLIQRTRSS